LAQLFLKYSQMDSELTALKKQSEVEREALMDALSETRNVVHDLRRERDELKGQVEYLSQRRCEHEDQAEDIQKLVRSRGLWQERAQSQAEQVERHEQTLQGLRAEIEAARLRQEELEDENLAMGSRIASLAAQLGQTDRTPSSSREPTHRGDSAATIGRSHRNGFIAPDEEDTATFDNPMPPPVAKAQVRPGIPSPRKSPTASAHSRNTSQSTFQTPSRLARARHTSNDSSINDMSANVNETPLVAQKPTFVMSPASTYQTNESEMGSPSRIAAKSKLPSPQSPNGNRIGRGAPAASGGIPRMRNISAASTISSTYHGRTPSVSSIGTVPEVCRPDKGTKSDSCGRNTG
jgi:myosin heavy subunit